MNDKQREKILKWCGFTRISDGWQSPDGRFYLKLPPIDLNFFDKWVFAKKGIGYSIDSLYPSGVRAAIQLDKRKDIISSGFVESGELLDALISALEKLIDVEVN